MTDTQKLTLSEAILKGSRLGPQLYSYLNKSLDDGRIASCAIGAAYLGSGVSTDCDLADYFPVLGRIVKSPINPEWVSGLWVTITDLNDCRRWSRVKIAKWIRDSGHDCEFVPFDGDRT